ncbi:MAG: hypothetical protein M3044_00180 [Thermoproteota archaeon]|nr:hypothetical protein [Thermoproteota archaeon]
MINPELIGMPGIMLLFIAFLVALLGLAHPVQSDRGQITDDAGGINIHSIDVRPVSNTNVIPGIFVPPPEIVRNSTTGLFPTDAPIAVSSNNLYVAWPNNDTGHWNVFFTKSIDNGKILAKTIIISAPNIGKTIDRNVQIAASGTSVYVTWWSNKTGVFEPLFRASTDNGTTFGKIIRLNSTAGGISK